MHALGDLGAFGLGEAFAVNPFGEPFGDSVGDSLWVWCLWPLGRHLVMVAG